MSLQFVIAACSSSSTNQHNSSSLNQAAFASALEHDYSVYQWPTDYRPNLVTLAKASGPGSGQVDAGYQQTVLDIVNQCAWDLSWYDAFERNDKSAAARALHVLSAIVPTFASLDDTGVQAARHNAQLAALGDPSGALSDAKANCANIAWKGKS